MTGLHPAERQAVAAARQRDAELAREPARRRTGGVVHTPPELARCVLSIADELLRERFDVPLGAVDPGVHLVDPACGPGAFLAAALRLWAARGAPLGVRMRGFDRDPAALASAGELRSHAPPDFSLHETDVLREPRFFELCEGRQVLAICGNPPWVTARADHTPAMQALLEDFRRDDRGERLPERKLGVLSDTYVRFARVCAEAVRRNPAGGVVALITNGSFLDGPVHRGMRAALRRWFDALYVLDLGGSALLQRTAAERVERDDNVFGVRPSVAITWLCRSPDGPADRSGEVVYARLRGTTADKLAALGAAGAADLGFESIAAERPLSCFAPRRAVQSEYAAWPSLADWFPFHREGVQTNRDRIAVDTDPARLLERLHAFARGGDLSELTPQAHFDLEQARRKVAAALERDPEGALGISVQRIAYRPFDVRWFCPVAPLCHRPRPELLQAIAHAPEVLIGVRKDRGFSAYSHFGAAALAIDNCFLSTRSSCRARAFPAHMPDGRDNLAPQLAAQLSERAGAQVTASMFQRYALAFLASASYRERFDPELHADYPRIPLPRTADAFRALSACGERLFSAWTEPLEPVGGEELAIVPDDLRCSELRLSAADGCMEARGERWFAADPAALELWLGHTQPIRAYLALHAAERFTPQRQASVRGLLRRIEAICTSIRHSDDWLRRLGHV